MVVSSEAGTSLQWLIRPVSTGVFFREYWDRQTLVVNRGQPDYFGGLLTLDEVDRALTTLDLRYPNVVLKNAARKVTADDYTVGGEALDVARVYQLFEEGSTITLAFLDNVIPALADFSRGLESEFSCPFQTNIYLTPARAQGARHHYDTHDVFVLQVAGSKHWTIYGTPLESPLSVQEFDSDQHERGQPTLQFTLEPGDVAYVPRGAVHDAQSADETSLHITAGVLARTWTELLLEAVAEVCLHDPAFRKSLPPGFTRQDFDPAEARRHFQTLFRRLGEQSSFDPILERFADDLVSSRPPSLRGQMAQLAALNTLSLDSVLGPRPNLAFYLRAQDDSLRLECYGRTLTFPARAAEAVRFALAHSEFTVRDLPGLDDDGKLTLARRLVREGLLMILPLLRTPF
ncbi:MAG TPA: cupin domain-containing protein [Terriglobia bacterium]|nr:cupin domain-containing protein [Terriglobia bacterium]